MRCSVAQRMRASGARPPGGARQQVVLWRLFAGVFGLPRGARDSELSDTLQRLLQLLPSELPRTGTRQKGQGALAMSGLCEVRLARARLEEQQIVHACQLQEKIAGLQRRTFGYRFRKKVSWIIYICGPNYVLCYLCHDRVSVGREMSGNFFFFWVRENLKTGQG